MNPLQRRLFRLQQPGMSRQPMGILASSPELMTAAQRAVAQGQPMQAADGAAVNTRGVIPDFLSQFASRNVAGSGDPREREFRSRSGMIPSLLQSLGNRAAAPDVSGSADLNEQAFRRGEVTSKLGSISDKLMAVLSKYPKSGFANELLEKAKNMSLEQQDAVADQIEASEIETISRGKDPSMSEGIATLKEVGDALTTPLDGSGKSKATEVGSYGVDPTDLFSQISAAQTSASTPIQEDLGTGVRIGEGQRGGEKIGEREAYQRSLRPAATDPSTLFPQIQEGTGERLAATDPSTLFPQIQEGTGEGLAATDPSTLFPQIQEKGMQSEAGATEDTKPAVMDPTQLFPQISKTQNDPEKTNKQKAKETDSLLNIKNLKERKAMLKELLGEEKAKDIRTDFGYNMMMTGLMIAAGESPDAMTNIAKGLAGGLKGYGEAAGEAAQAESKIDRELGLLAYQDLSAEQKAAKAAETAAEAAAAQRAFSATEAEKTRNFQATQNSLSRLSKEQIAELGLENQRKIAELSNDSRERIANLSRQNQMEIAQLPSKEIQGLLQVFGDEEGVRKYLEAKNKATKLLQGSTPLRGIEEILKNEELTEEILRTMPDDATPDQIAKLLVDGAKKIRQRIEAAASEIQEGATSSDGFGKMTTS